MISITRALYPIQRYHALDISGMDTGLELYYMTCLMNTPTLYRSSNGLQKSHYLFPVEKKSDFLEQQEKRQN